VNGARVSGTGDGRSGAPPQSAAGPCADVPSRARCLRHVKPPARLPRSGRARGRLVRPPRRLRARSLRNGSRTSHAMISRRVRLADGETAALLRAMRCSTTSARSHSPHRDSAPRPTPLEENQLRLLLRTDTPSAAPRSSEAPRQGRIAVAADAILYHHENVDGTATTARKGRLDPARRALSSPVARGSTPMTHALAAQAPLDRPRRSRALRDRRGGQWDGECVDALVGALPPQASHRLPDAVTRLGSVSMESFAERENDSIGRPDSLDFRGITIDPTRGREIPTTGRGDLGRDVDEALPEHARAE